MFSDLPADVSRRIYVAAVRNINERVVLEMATALVCAFDLGATRKDIFEYSTPIFEGSRDTLAVRAEYDGEHARIGAHRYSVDIDIAGEQYTMYKNEYEYDHENIDVSLQILKNSKNKYKNIVLNCFKTLFPNAIIYQI
jgi:hypothetical protein